MEIKVNALVIKAIDYKESDRILTLYSLEKGKITVGINGVKKAGAKLRFASEPFCFAEYILAEKGGRYTVTSASYIDCFYDLRLSLEKYYFSAVISDFLNVHTESEMVDPYLFDLSINSIKNVCYQDNEKMHVCNFLFKAIENLGYGISNLNCEECDEKINGRIFFRSKDASFRCESCREENFIEIKKQTYEALNLLKEEKYEILKEKSDGVDKLFNFLIYYLNNKTEVLLKSVEAINNLK